MKASSLKLVCEKLEDQMIDSLFKKDLSVSEVVSLFLIDRLKYPTIAEFANAVGISQSNATYTVHKLVSKGYLDKAQSQEDRRQFHLSVTDKFVDEIKEPAKRLERQILNVADEASEEEQEVIEKFFERCLDETL